MDPHYTGIIAGYAAGTAAIWLLWFVARPVVTGGEVSFARPWLEIGLVLLAAAATIGVGQLYVRHMLLPDRGALLEIANQALIFAPILLLVLWRAPRPAGAGLPLGSPMLGLPIGAALAVGVVFLYASLRGFNVQAVFDSALTSGHEVHAAQVLFEDIAIAALLLRLRAAIGGMWSVALVAALFAAGHIPAMLANGADVSQLTSLVLDTGIGVMVVSAVLATRSIWWLWPVHTAMDLMQFVQPT